MAKVIVFEVRDLGEDGSQYFPGDTASFSRFEYAQTGMGDTAREALEDALEQLATGDVEVSQEQEAEMFASLTNPDESAHASLEPHDDCDIFGCDWHHYVSIRYTTGD